jgi:hypothetical protein
MPCQVYWVSRLPLLLYPPNQEHLYQVERVRERAGRLSEGSKQLFAKVDPRVVARLRSASEDDEMTGSGEDSCSPGHDSCSPREDSCSPGQNSCSPGQNSCSPGENSCSPEQSICSTGQYSSSPDRKVEQANTFYFQRKGRESRRSNFHKESSSSL